MLYTVYVQFLSQWPPLSAVSHHGQLTHYITSPHAFEILLNNNNVHTQKIITNKISTNKISTYLNAKIVLQCKFSHQCKYLPTVLEQMNVNASTFQLLQEMNVQCLLGGMCHLFAPMYKQNIYILKFKNRTPMQIFTLVQVLANCT